MIFSLFCKHTMFYKFKNKTNGTSYRIMCVAAAPYRIYFDSDLTMPAYDRGGMCPKDVRISNSIMISKTKIM